MADLAALSGAAATDVQLSAEINTMEATKEDIALVKWETIDGQATPHELHRFGDSEVFDSGKRTGRPKALASKQLYRDEDGRTYLIERMNHQFFQSAQYPVVWDYSTVSRTMGSDTVWYARNTYYISSSLTVDDCELRIEPGTFVKFNDATSISVSSVSGSGKIIARGDPYLPIVFTAKDDDYNGENIDAGSSPSRGDYVGLEVREGSQIEFCSFYYARRAITVNGELDFPIQHNYFNTTRWAVYVEDSASVTIFNNLMVVDPCEPENDLRKPPIGIEIEKASSSANVYIRNNTIHCADVGLLLQDPDLPLVYVENNIFISCIKGILGEGQDDYDCLSCDYNGYYDNSTNDFDVTGKSIGGNSVHTLSESPYYSDTLYFCKFYLNDESGGGGKFINEGNGTPTEAGYTDPSAWSIHSVAMDYSSSNVFSSATTIDSSDPPWEPLYNTCDTSGDVDLGYHHPRVDYFINGATVTVDDSSDTLTVRPGTVVVQSVNSSTGAGKLVIDGTEDSEGEFVCVGEPFGDGYITWVDFFRARHDWYNGVPFSNFQNCIEIEDGSDYDIRFTKFLGLGRTVVPSEGSGTIRDSVFMLNVRGVDYQGCSDHTIQNCLFMGNNMGVRDYEGQGGEVVNCTFDHNIYGVSYGGTSLTVRNCLFHTNFVLHGAWAGIRIYNGTVAGLAEEYNAFYGHNHNIYDVTDTPAVSVTLNSTDYAYPANAPAATLTADPYDSDWVDFDDRFHLDQDGQCVVNGGDDPGYEGMPFYTTALDDRCDVPAVDIGYHYPGVVRFVDADTSAAAIDQDGLSWTTAYEYLQDALDEAGSEIITGIAVANGTYYPDEDKDSGHTETRTETFVLADGLGLYGGFEGDGEDAEDVFDFDMSTRNFVTYETILSGDIGTVGTDDTDNCYHVVVGADGAILDGFTITKGYADHASTAQYQSGGGMYNSSCSPAVANCIFDDNYALYGGGISNNGSSSPTVTDCDFTNNAALVWGGGMDNYDYSSPTITSCLFIGNEVTNGDSDDLGGGGIMCWSNCDATVVNCTFSQNTADNDSYGGGMYNKEASPTVTNCIFDDNYAESGGGMYNDSSSPPVTDCEFTDNEAVYWGGGMNNISSSPTITSCIFTGNAVTATNYGGGAINCYSSSDANIESCTLSQNSAANGYGGGIYIDASDPDIENTILWGNSDSIGADFVALNYSTITFNYSDYGAWGDDETTSFIGLVGIISTDPKFADAVSGDFHLKSAGGRWDPATSDWTDVGDDTVTSPCINTGDPSSSYSNEPTPNGSRINMGVYGNTSKASKTGYGSLKVDLDPITAQWRVVGIGTWNDSGDSVDLVSNGDTSSYGIEFKAHLGYDTPSTISVHIYPEQETYREVDYEVLTRYISTSGSDYSNDGKSPSSAWRTIKYAIHQVDAGGGGDLYFAGGYYTDVLQSADFSDLNYMTTCRTTAPSVLIKALQSVFPSAHVTFIGNFYFDQ